MRGTGQRDSRRSRPLRPRPWRPRAQPAQRRRRDPARRDGGVHGGLRVGQVLARLRHAVRRGAASLLRVGGAVRAAAAATGRGAARRGDHRPAAGGGAPATARSRHEQVVGRHHHDPVQPAPDALLASRRLPGGSRPPRGRGVLPQHRGRRLPSLPRPRGRPRRHRGAAGPRPDAEHPGGRDRGVARRVAGRQPPQHRDGPGHRHRPAVEAAEEEGPGLAAVHRRAAVGPDQARARPDRLRLLRQVLERAQARDARPVRLQERPDARARAAVRRGRAVS